MFCSNCGKEISDNQKFCSNCGASNVNNQSNSVVQRVDHFAPVVNKSVQQETLFNRDVLLNYLYNLQTLEFAKHKMIDDKDEMEYKISELGVERYIVKDKSDARTWIEGAIFMGVVFIISLIVSSALSGKGFWSLFDFLLPIVNFIMYGSLILAGLGVVLFFWDKIKDVERYNNEVAYEERRLKNERNQKKNLSNVLEVCNTDLEKTEELLTEAYALNIIPGKYRNVYAIYFLYDYLSTSTETLKDALNQCVLDEISKKLDVIIEQQREMIMQQARTNALTEHVIKQNDELIRRAIAIEENAELAAQYARVASINTQTVAQVQSYYFYKNS